MVCGVKGGEGVPCTDSERAVVAPVCSVYEIATAVVSPQYETLFRHPVHPRAIVMSTRLHGKSFENVHRYNAMSIRHCLISSLCRNLYKVGWRCDLLALNSKIFHFFHITFLFQNEGLFRTLVPGGFRQLSRVCSTTSSLPCRQAGSILLSWRLYHSC